MFRTFGVEIEGTGLGDWLLAIPSQIPGIPVVTRVGADDGVCYDGITHWTLDHDHSVRGPDYLDWLLGGESTLYTNHFEFSSWIFANPGDFQHIENLLLALQTAGAEVNITCGLHVHIGAKDLSDAQVMDVVKGYHAWQHVIDSMLSRCRTNNETCLPWSRKEIHETTKRRKGGKDWRWAGPDRHSTVNLCALEDHGTLEFRQHHGTLDTLAVEMWVMFLQKFVAYYAGDMGNYPLTPETKTIDTLGETIGLTSGEVEYWRLMQKMHASVRWNSCRWCCQKFHHEWEHPMVDKCYHCDEMVCTRASMVCHCSGDGGTIVCEECFGHKNCSACNFEMCAQSSEDVCWECIPSHAGSRR